MSCLYLDDENEISEEVFRKVLIFTTNTNKERKEMLNIIENTIFKHDKLDEIGAPIKEFQIYNEETLDRIYDADLNNFKVTAFSKDVAYSLLSFEDYDEKVLMKFANEKDAWHGEYSDFVHKFDKI